MAVVGEPSELEVLIGHRGVSRRKVIVYGRSAHSSLPSEGHNAIYPAASLATFIKELNERLSKHPHPLLGPGGVSATVIQGGIKDNVIPDRCELTIDRRPIPGEGPEKIDQEIEEWAQTLLAVDADLKYSVEVLGVNKEPVVISTDERIFHIAAEAAQEVTGKRQEPRGCIGASDMAFLVHGGQIPTIIFGPGKMAQAHVVDEFVEIQELELAASIYAGIVQRALGG
jgi:acetylornithine deacetylase/succinyl-diaminopimelate desuccinylase-like protein